jgi:hypothetical protein
MFARFPRTSVLILLPLLFWLGYMATYVFQGFSSFQEMSEVEIDRKVGSMKFIEKHAQTILLTEDMVRLSEYLNEALELHMIDYAVVRKLDRKLSQRGDKNIYVNFNIKKLEKIELDSFPSEDNVFITQDDTLIRTRALDYEMIVGLKTNSLALTLEMIKSLKNTILLDIATVTSMVLLITWLILKDVISLSRMLERGALPQNLRERKSLSSEGETLLRSTAAFEQNLKQTQASEQKWASTTSPAVLHEIRSGTPLGASFTALVVRIDLNHYTEYFVGATKTQLEDFLAKFFEASEELIPRYGGLVYQHVGDEIIFHFKEHERSQLLNALGCIRALFSEAESLHERLGQSSQSLKFTLKSSLQRGELRFHQLHKDHGFLGLPLIETARILGVVKDKTRHTLLLPRNLGQEAFELGECKNSQLYSLKGLSSEIFVEEFEFTATLGQALQSKNLSLMSTFRSEADFRQMFSWARDEWRHGNIEGLRQVLLFVQRVKIKKVEFESTQLILECILECHQGLNPSALQNSKDYASAMWLSLAVSYIPAGRAHSQLTELFFKYLDHPDQRVQAHAVAGLSRWGEPIPGLEKRINKTQGRLWAEVVQALAIIDFNEVLLHTIVSHRKKGGAENVRRCQYVSQQVLSHYRQHDAVQLESNPALRELASEFPTQESDAAHMTVSNSASSRGAA